MKKIKLLKNALCLILIFSMLLTLFGCGLLKDAEDVTQSDTDKSTASIEQTNSVDDQVDEGCDSSIALFAIALVGIIGTAFMIKKKED